MEKKSSDKGGAQAPLFYYNNPLGKEDEAK
jgi:hypothetical protein